MNILYLANHLNTGGISRYLLSLASAMKKRGHNIYVASGGGDLQEELTIAGAVCISMPLKTKCEIGPAVAVSFFRLLPLIKKYHIDIIHSNTRVTQVLGCLLDRYSGRPHISTCHGFFKPKLIRRLFPCWGRKAIAISRQVSVHLNRDLKVSEKDIVVINHGIAVQPFELSQARKKQARDFFGLSGTCIVGIIARLSGVKGHIYLVRAMEKALEQIPSAQLFIVGDGPMRPELLRLVKELGIEKHVILQPQVRDTAEALAAMDIFVLPSLKEGLGLALMEAMAAGLAVIGTEVGGIKTLITDGENGLLVRPSDSDDLSGKIVLLLKDEGERTRLGRSASQTIATRFPFGKMISQTENVYAACLNAKD